MRTEGVVGQHSHLAARLAQQRLEVEHQSRPGKGTNRLRARARNWRQNGADGDSDYLRRHNVCRGINTWLNLTPRKNFKFFVGWSLIYPLLNFVREQNRQRAKEQKLETLRISLKERWFDGVGEVVCVRIVAPRLQNANGDAARLFDVQNQPLVRLWRHRLANGLQQNLGLWNEDFRRNSARTKLLKSARDVAPTILQSYQRRFCLAMPLSKGFEILKKYAADSNQLCVFITTAGHYIEKRLLWFGLIMRTFFIRNVCASANVPPLYLCFDPCLVDGAMCALSEFTVFRLGRLDGEHFPESVLFESACVCRRRPARSGLKTLLLLHQKTLIVQIDRQKLLVIYIPIFWLFKIPKKDKLRRRIR